LGAADESGRRCENSPIPQGKILVQVIAKGYQTFGETVDVNEEEKTVHVKLNAPQQQYSAH